MAQSLQVFTAPAQLSFVLCFLYSMCTLIISLLLTQTPSFNSEPHGNRRRTVLARGQGRGLYKSIVTAPCGGGNILYRGPTSVGTPAVTAHCSAANWHQRGKLGTGCMGCLCTVVYYYIWIYSDLNIDSLIKKKIWPKCEALGGIQRQRGGREEKEEGAEEVSYPEGHGPPTSETCLPHSWRSLVSRDNSIEVTCLPETEAFSCAVHSHGKWERSRDTELLNSSPGLTEEHKKFHTSLICSWLGITSRSLSLVCSNTFLKTNLKINFISLRHSPTRILMRWY